MLLPVNGVTYQRTVGLIFGTNKCHIWYYAVSCFMGTCGHCDGALMIDSHQVLWSKIGGAILLFTLCAFGGFALSPRAALLVTRDMLLFSCCVWCHMIISHYLNVSWLLFCLFCAIYVFTLSMPVDSRMDYCSHDTQLFLRMWQLLSWLGHLLWRMQCPVYHVLLCPIGYNEEKNPIWGCWK